MLDMVSATSEELCCYQSCDPDTAAYYACLYELERKLLLLAREFGFEEQELAIPNEQTHVMQLQDVVLSQEAASRTFS